MKIFKNIVFIVLGLSLFNEWIEGKRSCHHTTVIDKAGNFQWKVGENCRRITLGGVRGKRSCHFTTAIDKAGNFQWKIGENCRRITLGDVRACPAEYKESFKQSCYMVVNDVKLNRYEAGNVCQRSSSHLLFIESQEEGNFITNITTPNRCHYWLGLKGLKDNLKWDDGTPVNYDSFAGNSFDDNSECHRIYKGSATWHDKDCSEKFCYICEYEK